MLTFTGPWLLCAGLIWLGAGIDAAIRATGPRDRVQALVWRGMAFAITGTGLWWSLRSVAAQSDAPTGALSFTVALALGAAASARLGRDEKDWRAGRRAGGVLATLVLAAGCVALQMSAPRLGGFGSMALLVHSVLLAAALIALAFQPSTQRRALWLRSAAALLGAGVLAAPLITLASLVPIESATQWFEPALLPILLLAGMGLGLYKLAREMPHSARIALPPSVTMRERTHDALTRLPTRVVFETELADAVVRCDSQQSKLALLFIDLDGFKPVNDTFGHSNGDRVLQEVGARLKAAVRGNDVVARVGGDEFLLMMGADATQETIAARAKAIIDALAQPYMVEDRDVAISCSIGIAFYPDSGAHTKLIARADAAMYAAKRAGGSSYCFYTPEMDADSRESFDLLRDLRGAHERNEMELYYQPKIDAVSGKVTAAEALLRWRHPERGLVLPGVFIPIAERFGLIGSLGNWVIEDACRQARVWQDHGLRMRVAINLSAMQMRQDDIVERIEGALARHRIDPSLLTCEITESVAMEDTRATQATFRELGAAGIHLSIDDFGTGYSSLAYLRRLPAEELKIDRSFVMDVEFSADARAVVNAVVRLAHALSLKVVAEGVENPRQQEILVKMGCDELQGYLFAKPMSARALLQWAIDDRKEETPAFSTSLFVELRGDHERSATGSDRDFARTAPGSSGDMSRAAKDAGRGYHPTEVRATENFAETERQGLPDFNALH